VLALGFGQRTDTTAVHPATLIGFVRFGWRAARFPLAGALATLEGMNPQFAQHTHAPTEATFTTQFLSAQAMVKLVKHLGLTASFAGVADAIEKAFARWEHFDKSARVACHSAQGVVELMPVADAQQFAFKYVNGHPDNHRMGLPTVMAFGVLADVATGAPRWLVELSLATAIRTAAMSAWVAQRLARPDRRRIMALIGNGAQSEFQALAFRDLVGVRELQLFDVDPAATRKLVTNLQGSGLVVRVCADVREAVQGAHIITTLTAVKGHGSVITPDMLEPGVHINAVGGDCPGKTELHPGVLDAARVFVEYEPQTRVEGDLQQMPPDFEVVELWRVLRGEHPGRTAPQEVTVFDSVGFALEDWATLVFMTEAAQRLGLGEPLQLVPTPADPKDLFGSLVDADSQAELGHHEHPHDIVHRIVAPPRDSFGVAPGGCPTIASAVSTA
jgi:ornithine cyclodeaminase